ncbi:MAG: PD40 domain-containing protein, partial [Caldilineaceae bacterium]|nr:PD40 domain-containing protein [Caldilineaceae bacterium]
ATTSAATTTQRTGPTGLSGTLVFQDGKGSIYLYELASGTQRYLTNGFEPEISRDGSKIAFTRYGDKPGLYTINRDGSGERQLYGTQTFVSSPKWNPAGDWLVFSRQSGEYKCFNLGSFLGCVTEARFCPFGFQCLPSELRTTKPEFMLARVDQDGDNYRDLNSLNTALAPDWNESGIVYDAATTIEITQDTPDGETTQVITGNWIQDADWQPDGGRIVYHQREGSHYEIFAVNTDGTGLVALTKPVTTLVDNLPSNVAPAWSPDGQHIVYLSSRDEANDRGDWRIWVMNADGSNQRPLPIDVDFDYGFAHEQMIGWGQ